MCLFDCMFDVYYCCFFLPNVKMILYTLFVALCLESFVCMLLPFFNVHGVFNLFFIYVQCESVCFSFWWVRALEGFFAFVDVMLSPCSYFPLLCCCCCFLLASNAFPVACAYVNRITHYPSLCAPGSSHDDASPAQGPWQQHQQHQRGTHPRRHGVHPDLSAYPQPQLPGVCVERYALHLLTLPHEQHQLHPTPAAPLPS